MSETTPTPGDRLHDESTPAFAAFRTYLEMGPARSTAKVARECGKQKSLMDRWSKRHRWVDRVAAYEAQATRAVDVAHLDAIARRSERQAQIAQLHGEATALVAKAMVEKVQLEPDALKALDLDELVRLEAAMARAHNRVVVTERLALGISTDNPSAGDTPRTAAEEAARRLSDAELEAKLAGVDELAAARARRAARRREKKAAKG